MYPPASVAVRQAAGSRHRLRWTPDSTPDSPTPPPDIDTGPPADRDHRSAEELDEDRLRVDPLEAGMDPPEDWAAVDSYGVTPYEQRHPRPLSDRLAQEEPEPDAPRAD